MFGHLKPQDFLNFMESGETPAVHRIHLESCARCRETWESLKPLHAEVASLDTEIAEPDWAEFRSSVRDELLSRSIQRQSAAWPVWPLSRWTVRPAVAWMLSLLLAVGIPTGAFVWHLQKDNNTATRIETTSESTPAADFLEAGTEKTVFDDLMDLSDSEQAQLQQMLLAAQKGTSQIQ
jgi:hypothetical protein